MVPLTASRQLGQFYPGFAHLALRVTVENLMVLPVAISSEKEWVRSPFTIRTLKVFDPSELLFDRDGWHPVLFYRQVNVLIGCPDQINIQFSLTTPTKQQPTTTNPKRSFSNRDMDLNAARFPI